MMKNKVAYQDRHKSVKNLLNDKIQTIQYVFTIIANHAILFLHFTSSLTANVKSVMVYFMVNNVNNVQMMDI